MNVAMRESFNGFEYDKATNTIIDMETGEIIDNNKGVAQKLIEDKKKEDKYRKAKAKALKEGAGIEDKKDTHKFNWKSDSNFIKHYRTEKREYMKQIDISLNALGILSYIENYIEMESNRMAKKTGDNFTNKELIDLFGVSSKTLKNLLNELEEKHFIKRVGNRQAREIYYNPYFMCSGNVMSFSTIDLFKDYKPITAY